MLLNLNLLDAVVLASLWETVRALLAAAWPFLMPVAVSFLFTWLTKAITWVNNLGTWPKRIAIILLNGAGATIMALLGLTGPGEFLLWDQQTLEALLAAIASLFLFDNGQATTAAKLAALRVVKR